MEAKFYQVGGCVRDAIMGVRSKDIDFSVEAESYEAMCDAIRARGCEIKVEHPEFVTVRAIDKVLGGVDFVLCRKESDYSDGRHPDKIEVGTLEDDLRRRDFTMNAIAQADDGTLIDLFEGQHDIACKVIRCVGDTYRRFREDKLRILRALRFSITKGFTVSSDIYDALRDREMVAGLQGVSVERIREELLKCFECNTQATLQMLNEFPLVREACFANRNLILKPTIRG